MCEDCTDRNQNLHLCWPHASFFNTSMWIPLYVFLFISSCVFYRMLVLQSVEHPFRLSQSPWTAWCFQSRQRQVKQSESGRPAFGEHGPCAGHRARCQRTTCRWSIFAPVFWAPFSYNACLGNSRISTYINRSLMQGRWYTIKSAETYGFSNGRESTLG